MNLRMAPHMSAGAYQALIDTVMGAPEESILTVLEPPAPQPPYKLTREQREQWYHLVVDRGIDVNLALQITRGLL